MKPIVYIYNGAGTSKVSIAHTIYSLKKCWPDCVINTLNAHDVIGGNWIKDAHLFIMPGGADRPYGRALNGAGNQVIQNYICNGGSYLGICAGAYYACAQIKFSVNTDLEITGSRELNFFKGVAIGPTLASYDYQSNQGARAAILILNDVINISNESCVTFFNGGCHFAFNDYCLDTTIVAYYEFNHQPAIIDTKIGQGRVILSGVHIEYDPDILDRKDPYLENFYHSLKSKDNTRMMLWINLVNQLINR